MKNRIKELVYQLVPIAFGVYIGIVAGNWNERRLHKQDQLVFIENIIKEFESNNRKLEQALKYHNALDITIDSLLKHSKEEVLLQPFYKQGGFEFIPGWIGIKIPSLESSVYESGMISNLLRDLDFETINKLSKVYNFQKVYKEITKPIINRIITFNHETKTLEVLMTTQFLGKDGKIMEYELIRIYKELIEFLKQKYH